MLCLCSVTGCEFGCQVGEEKAINIYVGNLPRASTEDEIRTLFEAHGEVTSVAIIKDRYTGESRGFGFVEMPSKEEAEAAIEGMNGKEVKGRAIAVNVARPRSDDRRGGHGGGRGSDDRGRRW